tara:strand:+ start:279 stop:689 length:411 start_codon:yes stop_codon:yes gene_type:complete
MFLLKSSKKNLFSRKSSEKNISFFNKKSNIHINDYINNDTNDENTDHYKNDVDSLIYYIEILSQKIARLNNEVYTLENKMLELQTKYNNELSILKIHKYNSFKNKNKNSIIFIKKIKIYIILLNLLYFINNFIKYI